jgi:hypothetical protein
MSTEPGTYIASARPLRVFIGRCEPCNRPVRASSDAFIGDHYTGQCPDCRKWTLLQRLYGTVTKMECTSACMGAYGPRCDCACGGINHGDVWSRPGEMLADALAVYRRLREQRAKAAEKASRTRAEKKAARLRAAFEAWADGHADLIAELIGTDWLTHRYPNDFLAEMAAIVNREEPLTEPQTFRSIAILDRRREVAERVAREQAERDARNAKQAEQAGALFAMVPTERRMIEGEIIAAWPTTGDYGTFYTIKVDCGEFQVRGTLPRNLETEALPQPYNGDDWVNLRRTLPGRRVKLRATLKPDSKETDQGWFRRPSNAEFVTEPAQVSS